MPNGSHLHRKALCLPIVLAATASQGCSKSAIVHNTRGPAIEGPIVGADTDSITVEVGGVPRVIPREDIRDIDHPGNAWLVFGALNTAVGVAWAIGAYDVVSEFEQGPFEDPGETLGDGLATTVVSGTMLALSLIHLAMGVPTAIWGGMTWHDSRRRAEAPPPATVHVGPGGVLVRF